MKFLTQMSIAALALACVAGATAADGDNKRKPHRKPPPAAVEACASFVAGDPCEFTGRRDQQVTGTCFAPAEKPLACRPDNPPSKLYREQKDTE